jgi:hypothetical protein
MNGMKVIFQIILIPDDMIPKPLLPEFKGF